MPNISVWLFWLLMHEKMLNLSPSAMSYNWQFTWFNSLVKLIGSKIASFGLEAFEYSRSWPSCIWELEPHPYSSLLVVMAKLWSPFVKTFLIFLSSKEGIVLGFDIFTLEKGPPWDLSRGLVPVCPRVSSPNESSLLSLVSRIRCSLPNVTSVRLDTFGIHLHWTLSLSTKFYSIV